MKTYTHTEIMDRAQAVEALPRLSGADKEAPAEEPEAMRKAAGAEGDEHHICHHSGDTEGHDEAWDGSEERVGAGVETGPNAFSDSGIDADWQCVAADGGNLENGGGGGNRTRVP